MMKSLDLPCRISEDFGNISDISHPSALIMGASQHLSQTRHVHFGVSQSLVRKAATAPSCAIGHPCTWNPMPCWSSHIKPKLGHLEAKQCGPYRTDAGVCEIPGKSTGRHIWHMMLSSFLHHGLCLWCGEWWSDVTWRWVTKKSLATVQVGSGPPKLASALPCWSRSLLVSAAPGARCARLIGHHWCPFKKGFLEMVQLVLQ